jgi:hypothetical protein
MGSLNKTFFMQKLLWPFESLVLIIISIVLAFTGCVSDKQKPDVDIMYKKAPREAANESQPCKNVRFTFTAGVAYDTIYPMRMDRCKYIILKRRDTVKTLPAPIDMETAITHVQWYNERFNPELRNTAFVDFELEEMWRYLIDATEAALEEKKDLRQLRIYLSDQNEPTAQSPSISTILILKSDTAEFYRETSMHWPRNYGHLCPTPSDMDCIGGRYSGLLQAARQRSTVLP